MSPSKDLIRRRCRRARRDLAVDQRQRETRAVVAGLWWLLQRMPQRPLASYAAMAGELSLRSLHQRWWALGEPVWLPRVLGDGALCWHATTSEDDCVVGAFGVREPRVELPRCDHPPADALVIVPGVAFTAAGARLGQGGGFYDRVLPHHRGPRIGVAFACQMCAELPGEVHDVPVDAVCAGGTWYPAGMPQGLLTD